MINWTCCCQLIGPEECWELAEEDYSLLQIEQELIREERVDGSAHKEMFTFERKSLTDLDRRLKYVMRNSLRSDPPLIPSGKECEECARREVTTALRGLSQC